MKNYLTPKNIAIALVAIFSVWMLWPKTTVAVVVNEPPIDLPPFVSPEVDESTLKSSSPMIATIKPRAVSSGPQREPLMDFGAKKTTVVNKFPLGTH